MMKLRLRKETEGVPADVLAGEAKFPRLYGLAWIDYTRNVIVCYPIPLNLIMGKLRRGWEALLLGGSNIELTVLDAECAIAYENGFTEGESAARKEATAETFIRAYNAGRRDGYKEGLQDATNALRQ